MKMKSGESLQSLCSAGMMILDVQNRPPLPAAVAGVIGGTVSATVMARHPRHPLGTRQTAGQEVASLMSN